VNDRIAVDLFINHVQVFFQSEKLDDERFLGSLIEEDIPSLPDGKNPVRRLNNIGIESLGKSKKLSAFQGVLK
jgi:hypothetical protein